MRTKILAVAVVFVGLACNEQRNKAVELMNQGVSKYHNRLFDSAEKELQAAIATDPTYVLARYNLGKVYEEQKKWKEASEEYAKAVSGEGNNENYHYDLGHAYQENGQFELAEKELQEAFKLIDKLFKAYFRLGV